MLDLSLTSGRSPLSLLDGGHPDVWTELDLEVMSQYRHMKEAKCPGCGRPVAQHLYNSTLGREETPSDYIPYALDCPSMQAVAAGQDMWKTSNRSAIDSHNRGKGPDPSMGVYWLTQGHNESLPQTDEPDK